MCQSKFLNTLFQKVRGKQSNKTRRNFWKRCEDGKVRLKSEEDGGGRDLASLQRAPGATGQGDSV